MKRPYTEADSSISELYILTGSKFQYRSDRVLVVLLLDLHLPGDAGVSALKTSACNIYSIANLSPPTLVWKHEYLENWPLQTLAI